MTERKLQRHVQSFSHHIGGVSTFSIDLYCPFKPDEIRVKQVAYAGTDVKAFTLHCDALLPTAALTSFMSPCLHFVGMTFPCTTFNTGTYKFSVRWQGVDDTDATSTINLTLEYRKFV